MVFLIPLDGVLEDIAFQLISGSVSCLLIYNSGKFEYFYYFLIFILFQILADQECGKKLIILARPYEPLSKERVESKY